MADWYFRNPQNHNGQNSRLRACPACGALVRNEEYCPQCARRLRPEGGLYGMVKKLRGIPFFTTRLILALMVLGFVLQMAGDFFLPAIFRDPPRPFGLFSLLTSNGITYVRLGSNFQPLTLVGDYWRLLTHCFLHFGIIHILFNGMALRTLGQLAERLWGGRQVFATFILTGVAGGAASLGWSFFLFAMGWGRLANSAGASGAICGILGLFLGAYYRNRNQISRAFGSQIINWAVMVIAFGIFADADNAAHIGGMLAGAVFGYFLPPTQFTKTPARDAKIWNAATIAAIVLLLVCVGFAVAFYLQGPLSTNHLAGGANETLLQWRRAFWNEGQ